MAKGFVGDIDNLREVKAFLRSIGRSTEGVVDGDGVKHRIDELYNTSDGFSEADQVTIDREVERRIGVLESAYGPLGNGSRSGKKM